MKNLIDKAKVIEKAMAERPCGLLVITFKDSIVPVFWQRPMPESQMIFWENLVTGVVQNGISRGFMTKASVITAIKRSCDHSDGGGGIQ